MLSWSWALWEADSETEICLQEIYWRCFQEQQLWVGSKAGWGAGEKLN